MVFIAEAFFSGCISKVINDGIDYSRDKIKKGINDKNNCSLSIKIYRVIENALNIVTGKNFKGTDVLYEAIERIFIEFRDNGDTIESVRCGLGLLSSDVSIEKCENFLDKFYAGMRQDNDLYKAINMLLQQKGIHISQEGFQKINETVEYGFDQLNRKIDNLADSSIEKCSVNEKKETRKNLIFQNDKKQKYIENWNSRLFLHMDNNENPITLADAFIMPEYKIYKNIKRIDFSDNDTLDQIIEKFASYDNTSTMLITGVPGIGKSTIASWIANRYKEDDRFIILRFRDWEYDELENGLLRAIYNILECKRKDLFNKVLVLDGFDEMKALDIRDKLLSEFLTDIKDVKNFKSIITSRPAYIKLDIRSKIFQNVLELQTFDVEKIDKFCIKISGNGLDKKEKIKSNLDVIGIPVILYMAIMAKIDISENPTKPELYCRIFAKEGGIFDKFFDGENEYSEGSQILRNPDNIKKYLKFLRDIAFEMFKKNELSLSKEKYHVPELEFQGRAISILEFPIKHLFDNTEINIEFVHKSIYEYFVSEYIYLQINKVIHMSKKEIAKVLGNLLVRNNLNNEILEFLKYEVQNNMSEKYRIMEEVFQLMMKKGMTYYANEINKSVLHSEMTVFQNMMKIVALWEGATIIQDNMLMQYINLCKNA